MSRASDFFKLVADAFKSVPDEMVRGMNRFSGDLLTRQHMFREVERVSDVPVSGDVLARFRKPAAEGTGQPTNHERSDDA